MTIDSGQPVGMRENRVSTEALTVRLSGELDIGAREHFEEMIERRLAEEGLRELVVDLNGLSFIDSSGLRMLVQAKTQADREGVDLFVLVPPEGQVREIWELSGLDIVFPPPETT